MRLQLVNPVPTADRRQAGVRSKVFLEIVLAEAVVIETVQCGCVASQRENVSPSCGENTCHHTEPPTNGKLQYRLNLLLNFGKRVSAHQAKGQ